MHADKTGTEREPGREGWIHMDTEGIGMVFDRPTTPLFS